MEIMTAISYYNRKNLISGTGETEKKREVRGRGREKFLKD